VSKDIFARGLRLSAAQRLVAKKKRTAGTKVWSAGLMNKGRPMSYQDFEGTESPSSDHQSQNQKMRDAAGETFSRASDNARDAAAKRGTEGASSLSDSVMGLLNQQLGAGADAAGRFASSMRLAAHDMERDNPSAGRCGSIDSGGARHCLSEENYRYCGWVENNKMGGRVH
jgi:hypothetical protein